MTFARSSLSSSLAVLALCGALAMPAFAQAPAPAMPAAPADPAMPETPPPPPETVLATVNGQKITQLDVTLATEDLATNIAQQLKGKARDSYVLDYLIDSALVSQKAKADKLEDTPDFAAKVEYAKDKVLMESVLTRITKTATSDANLHKIYDQAAAAQKPPEAGKPQEEIHARHILVATEADAQTALKRLKAGEDFAKVAKDMSKDPGAEGGDLGWFTKERMVPEFADAAFKLKDGEISEPVKSQFGWHIIQVEGHRTSTPPPPPAFPPFDQVKDQIVHYAVQKAQTELILSLRKDAKIERTAAAPPPADAPAPGK